MILLTLTTTPQAIVAQTVCHLITVKEDEGIVASSGGVAFIITKGGSVQNNIQAGKFYAFPCPGPNRPWQPGETVGSIFLATGSTTAVQDELS